MSANGEMIRKYTLSYSVSDSTGRSTLESVALYGSDNMSQLPPIHFQYGPVSNEWFSPDLVFHNGPDVKGVIARQCLEGDFNGDGRTDIACYTGQGGLWHVALSTGTNWNATYWDYGPQVKVPVSDQCFAADFSGDGKTDLACYTGSSGKWLVAISTGTGFRSAYWNGGPSPGIPVRNQCVAGEFGGPGRAAIACLVSGDTWHVALSNGSGWALSTDWHSGPAPSGPVWQQCSVGDVDGDGKTDLLCSSGNGVWSVARSLGTQWSTGAWSGPAEVPSNCYRGDFNGDGLLDIACQRPDKHWIVSLSTGRDWDNQDWGSDPDKSAMNCTPGDFNGDGKTDIACYFDKTQTWRVALSTGGSFRVSQWAYGASFKYPFRCFAGDVIGAVRRT